MLVARESRPLKCRFENLCRNMLGDLRHVHSINYRNDHNDYNSIVQRRA